MGLYLVYLLTPQILFHSKYAWKCIEDKIKIQEYAVSRVSSDTVFKILPNPGSWVWLRSFTYLNLSKTVSHLLEPHVAAVFKRALAADVEAHEYDVGAAVGEPAVLVVIAEGVPQPEGDVHAVQGHHGVLQDLKRRNGTRECVRLMSMILRFSVLGFIVREWHLRKSYDSQITQRTCHWRRLSFNTT